MNAAGSPSTKGPTQSTAPTDDPAPAGEPNGDVMAIDEAAAFLRIGRNALYDAIRPRGCSPIGGIRKKQFA